MKIAVNAFFRSGAGAVMQFQEASSAISSPVILNAGMLLKNKNLEVKIMKNVEQLIIDMKADEELRKKFREGLNKLRGDETLSVMEAGRRVARELGYEVSEDEAKSFITRFQNRRGQDKTQLNDDELENVAGGFCLQCGNCWLSELL